MTFTDRNAGNFGIPIIVIQIDSINEELKNSLWIMIENSGKFNPLQNEELQLRGVLELVWTNFIKKPKSNLIGFNNHIILNQKIKKEYDVFPWDKVYSFIEFIIKIFSEGMTSQ